jgi:hypothetical protein
MSQALYQDVIDACNRCASACDHCTAACLEEDNLAMMATCIRLDIQCAAICRLLALYLHHDSQFIPALATLCRTVCQNCAEECTQHAHEHCQACADACQACARACEVLPA